MKILYKFRQVKCPLCGHIFMWQKEPVFVGNSYCMYKRKGLNEELENAICPKCNLEMVVPNDSLKGIDINSEDIEVAYTSRGL